MSTQQRVIPGNGKSVCWIDLVNTMRPCPSWQLSVAVALGVTCNVQTMELFHGAGRKVALSEGDLVKKPIGVRFVGKLFGAVSIKNIRHQRVAITFI